MAGLQYNFFPTDFFYPRPKSVVLDASPKVILPLQQDPIRDVTKNFEGSKALVKKTPVKVQALTLKKQGENLSFSQNQRLPCMLVWTPEEPKETS